MVNDKNDNSYISRMRSAAFDESQNIAQPVPSHPPLNFLTHEFVDSNINLSGTLISLPALMDKPISTDFASSMDPTFVLQNIFAANVNSMLHDKGYVPSIQAKDMGKALATHIRMCTGSGFDNTQDECTIQMDLLARIIAYAAIELNMEVTDYTVALHGSTIPLIIYREVQEDWDFSGNSDNFLLSNTVRTIQDDLDEAFTNRLHKNIMAITTLAANFTQKEKHAIMDSIANETPLPEEWSFTDEKGHKCMTYGWLTGNIAPKTSIPPATSFSPNVGQKRPLETDHNTEEITRKEQLEALKFQLPIPQSVVEASLDAWTTTTNTCMDICHSKYQNINPEHFIKRIRTLARSKDQKALAEFEDEHLRHLLHEVKEIFSTDKQIMDSDMEDISHELSKIDIICKTTAIWKETAKTMWNKNILMCNQATLDQATRLLLLEDTNHKYSHMTQEQLHDMEIDRRDQIIARITALNESACKVISDIKRKSIPTKDKEKIELITRQGWETAKRAILQNPTKFFPSEIPPSQRTQSLDKIISSLKNNDDHEWAFKVIQDIKNKGLQAKATEHCITTIIYSQKDQDMIQEDPIPWTETEDYKQNRKLWMDTASEIFEKLSPYFPNEDRKMKEELYCEAADICAAQDKDLLQLQSISSLTDSNKKRELEEMRKFTIDKEFQSLLQAEIRRQSNQRKHNFEDYLATKDFEYYVQHTRDQITNPAVPTKKKETLKHLIKQAEQTKWSPKHLVDEDGSILPDSPPPSPPPKNTSKPNVRKSKPKTDSKQEAENTRKGNTPNTRHLQKLLNDMNKDNGMEIMREIHRISEKDKLADATQRLTKSEAQTKDKSQSYAQKASTTKKDPRKDGAGGWKTIGTNNKISRATILPPPPNVFKFFVMDDETTLPSPKQTDEDLTDALNSIISENVEWLLALGSNHIKSAAWSKDPKAIVVTMTHNIDKNREDDLPDGKNAFKALHEVVLDLFPDATLAS
ncbi:hypothetical protein AMATHDRAFT_10327 [Amanita thiersii Skay4041]|uniref:Uncharacterized protein n=1 Tax=Amanita thiersii Skay4041 TaxID=703135 RepID=A0A2A9N6U6_9AGAR|nr:hypothetical protein AMATHDRAFT_10327 [Amanita thiersii Skay4041]